MVPRLNYDVVCIGAGGAGITTSIAAALSGAKVALLSREPIGYGNTRIALGGVITRGLGTEDSTERFLDEILASGEGLNKHRVAKVIADEAPEAALTLERFGLIFTRDEKSYPLSYSSGGRPTS